VSRSSARPGPAPAPDGGARPVALAVVCLTVLLQAASLLGLGAAWATDLARGRSDVPGATVFLMVFAWTIAAVLVFGARSLWRGRRVARAPIFTWQLILAVLSYTWISNEPTAWATAVLVSAVLVGVGLFLPAVAAATAASAVPTDLDPQ